MRVAALYDVHGNLPALEAVLAEVDGERVDAIVFGGDVASGPFPRETVDLVRSLDALCIRGNADRLVRQGTRDDLLWVAEQLDADQIQWLESLPFSAVLDDTLYVHATPRSDETVVTVLTTDERLAEELEGVEQSRVVVGHTHMQVERRVGEIVFVCAGSVGFPYEAQPGAYWALLDDRVHLRRTDYDLERAAARIRASGYPIADEIAADNIMTVPTHEDALAVFGHMSV